MPTRLRRPFLLAVLAAALAPGLARSQGAEAQIPGVVPVRPEAASSPAEPDRVGSGAPGPWAVRAGWGSMSMLQFESDLWGALTPVATLGLAKEGPARVLGPAAIAAERDVNGWLTVGLGYSYLRIRREYYVLRSPAGTSTDTFHTVLAQGLARYLSRGSFHLYSGLSVGATFYRGTLGGTPGARSSDSAAVYHVHALGLRWGERVGVWADVGIGVLGMVNGGVMARF